MAPVQYFLPRHVFIAPASHHVVVLDVRRDRYSCIPRRLFDPLTPWMQGWPAAQDGAGRTMSDSEPDPELAKQADALLSQGILTRSPRDSKPVRPIPTVAPRCEVSPEEHGSACPAFVRLAAFLRACRRADRALRTAPLEAAIGSIAARKRTDSTRIRKPATCKAERLACAFAALRLLYPRPALCTFDSLALLHFLATWHIHPTWVFGVRADPFRAHCWVQLDHVLLNDRVEQVARFVPIMTV